MRSVVLFKPSYRASHDDTSADDCFLKDDDVVVVDVGVDLLISKGTLQS